MLINSRGRNNKFKQKLDMWGFQKNLKPRQSRFIRRNAKRGQIEGKKIEFRIKHGKVPRAKVQRLLKAKQDASSSESCSMPRFPILYVFVLMVYRYPNRHVIWDTTL